MCTFVSRPLLVYILVFLLLSLLLSFLEMYLRWPIINSTAWVWTTLKNAECMHDKRILHRGKIKQTLKYTYVGFWRLLWELFWLLRQFGEKACLLHHYSSCAFFKYINSVLFKKAKSQLGDRMCLLSVEVFFKTCSFMHMWEDHICWSWPWCPCICQPQ